MNSPVETTAAMTQPADQPDPANADRAHERTAGVEHAATHHADQPDQPDPTNAPAPAKERREMSHAATLALFSGLVTALMGGLFIFMAWQFGALNDRIDAQGARLDARIDQLGTDLRGELHREIGMLRSEMQAGFASVNEILLDHTDRLARLETAAGLPRPN